MALFTIWESDEGGITLKRGSGPPTWGQNGPPEEGAVKVAEFQAASWNEACQKQCDHYGWSPYIPHDNWEEIGPDEE